MGACNIIYNQFTHQYRWKLKQYSKPTEPLIQLTFSRLLQLSSPNLNSFGPDSHNIFGATQKLKRKNDGFQFRLSPFQFLSQFEFPKYGFNSYN